MRYRFFSIDTQDPTQGEAELDRYLNEHKVINVERQLVQAGEQSHWAICVQIAHETTGSAPARTKDRIDYKDVLSPEDFSVFIRLREHRNELARQQGIPPYAVFNNEQLASIARLTNPSLSGIGEIKGIGSARLEQYGASFKGLKPWVGSLHFSRDSGKEASR